MKDFSNPSGTKKKSMSMQWSRNLPIVLILLGMQSATGVAQQSSSPVVSDALMRAIEGVSLATLSLGEAVRPAIDRAAFDQGILLNRLDFDDAAIVRFVTEDIAYQQYAGVLRGARGTLLARAGNALDQSLLLATLLNDAGFETTIRSGTLTVDDAARLLGMLAQSPEQTVTPAPASVAKAQAQLHERFEVLLDLEAREGRTPGISMDEITDGIARDRDDLLAALGKAGIRLGDGQASAALLQEAREYYWVDYRSGPSAPWKSVHVVFGATPPPEVTVTASYTAARYPDPPGYRQPHNRACALPGAG
jgi:transglutaminase-like putative cysteine protease